MARVEAPAASHESRQPLTDAELHALVIGARAGRNPLRDEALVVLALDCGGRAAELCQVSVEAVMTGTLTCHIIGKQARPRELFWGGETQRLLARLVRQGRLTTGPVFLTQAGRPFSVPKVQRLVLEAGRRGGVERRLHPHLLRHSCATRLLAGGTDLFSAQAIMGHADLSTLRRYTKTSTEALQAGTPGRKPRRAPRGRWVPMTGPRDLTDVILGYAQHAEAVRVGREDALDAEVSDQEFSRLRRCLADDEDAEEEGREARATTWTCEGDVRGACDVRHRSREAALKCCDRDSAGCAGQGGYSDRYVQREAADPATPTDR